MLLHLLSNLWSPQQLTVRFKTISKILFFPLLLQPRLVCDHVGESELRRQIYNVVLSMNGGID